MNFPLENSRTLRELPPRSLDWFTQAVMLCGDFLSQTGWALLAIGSFFFWTTAVRSEVKIWFEAQTSDWREISGTVERADSTNSIEKRQRIWKFTHSFWLDNEKFHGTSYAIGKKFDKGQTVYIHYDAAAPKASFIIGNRRSQYSWRVNLLLLIPLLGLVFVLYPVRQNFRFLKVLKIGDFTRGKLVEKHATRQTVRNGSIELPVFTYRFEFGHEGVIYHATCRTHHTNLVEDEETEIILFDKYNPTNNLVYDAVPNVPAIDDEGKMLPIDRWKAWALFLPAFFLAINAVFALLS